MKLLKLASAATLIGLTAACSSFGPSPLRSTQPAAPQPSNPKQATATAAAALDVSAFIDPAIAAKLSDADRAEASSAQFYALQFGRPAAPRDWQGQSGNSGKVTVGPYVQVNNLDCRDFTHTVTASGKSYPRSGLACRDQQGVWTVVQAKNSA